MATNGFDNSSPRLPGSARVDRNRPLVRTSLTNDDGGSVDVLSSYPAWRGLALHSLAVAVHFVCVTCQHPRDSTMVATHERHGGLVCPGCYAQQRGATPEAIV